MASYHKVLPFSLSRFSASLTVLGIFIPHLCVVNQYVAFTFDIIASIFLMKSSTHHVNAGSWSICETFSGIQFILPSFHLPKIPSLWRSSYISVEHFNFLYMHPFLALQSLSEKFCSTFKLLSNSWSISVLSITKRLVSIVPWIVVVFKGLSKRRGTQFFGSSWELIIIFIPPLPNNTLNSRPDGIFCIICIIIIVAGTRSSLTVDWSSVFIFVLSSL